MTELDDDSDDNYTKEIETARRKEGRPLREVFAEMDAEYEQSKMKAYALSQGERSMDGDSIDGELKEKN